MKIGNYGETREPVLTELERVTLTVARQFDWAERSYESIPEGTNADSKGYLRGYRDAMKEIREYLDYMKGTPL